MLLKKIYICRRKQYIKYPRLMFHIVFMLSLCSMATICYAGTENLTLNPSTSTPTASMHQHQHQQNVGTRTLLRIYDECTRIDGGFVPCLKKKAISFIDRISHIDAITIADGVKLIRLQNADATNGIPLRPLTSENELENIGSRSSDDRDTKLTNLLIERLSYFFNGHSLQVSFPKLTSDEIGRGLEEGRGKMKKMMSMMMMGMAMKMMGMIPVAMGALYMLAGKALIISKIALLLAGIMGLKKLMSGRGGSGGGSGWSSGGGGGGWSSGGGGSSGGWDRRSLNEAHELAYRNYSRHQQQQQQQQQQGDKQPQQYKEDETKHGINKFQYAYEEQKHGGDGLNKS